MPQQQNKEFIVSDMAVSDQIKLLNVSDNRFTFLLLWCFHIWDISVNAVNLFLSSNYLHAFCHSHFGHTDQNGHTCLFCLS